MLLRCLLAVIPHYSLLSASAARYDCNRRVLIPNVYKMCTLQRYIAGKCVSRSSVRAKIHYIFRKAGKINKTNRPKKYKQCSREMFIVIFYRFRFILSSDSFLTEVTVGDP